MIRRVRLTIVLVRPPVLVLLAMFAAVGLAQSNQQGTQGGLLLLPLFTVLVVVAAFLLFSVAVNDLADEAIDRVNLPGHANRPLVTGAANRREMVISAVVASGLALVVSALLPWPSVLVAVGGLALSAAYSVRPVRLADRGAVASLILPACYVTVPYLLGVLAPAGRVRLADLVLLAGLYLGFVGRILLKDFRDVRGDALFGKRTFLVRHGRRATCVFSAACWLGGTVLLLAAVRHPTVALVGGQVLALAIALALLRVLAGTTNPHREEAVIAAIAIVGRGMIVMLLAHLAMTNAHWPIGWYSAALAGVALLTVGQALTMARYGPSLRTLKLPEAAVEPIAADHR
jgi:4-hydroxybenzoate polyprenyltransferase